MFLLEKDHRFIRREVIFQVTSSLHKVLVMFYLL